MQQMPISVNIHLVVLVLIMGRQFKRLRPKINALTSPRPPRTLISHVPPSQLSRRLLLRLVYVLSAVRARGFQRLVFPSLVSLPTIHFVGFLFFRC